MTTAIRAGDWEGGLGDVRTRTRAPGGAKGRRSHTIPCGVSRGRAEKRVPGSAATVARFRGTRRAVVAAAVPGTAFPRLTVGLTLFEESRPSSLATLGPV